MSQSKDKGTRWETAIVDYLHASGVPHAERRANGGTRDRGDITGIPGVVIEAKAERPYRLAEWLAEAERERANDRADIAVVWAKRIGKTGAEHGYVIITPAALIKLLAERTEGAQP